MQVRLVAYGIAREILIARQLDFEFNGSTIGELKASLIAAHPGFSQLKSLSFAVLENYRQDDFVLSSGTEVVIIPPVSGG